MNLLEARGVTKIYGTLTALEQADLNVAPGEFHGLIGKASRNRVLQLAREPSELLVMPTTEMILARVEQGAERLLHAHRMYVDAIRRRDKDAGRLWVKRHLEDWRKGFERAGKDLDQPIDRIYLESS